MLLYIIRHADPDYEHNTITEFGWQEAHALADWLQELPIDRIYSSPMGRAIDTATPICKIKGMEPVILPWAAEHQDYMTSLRLTPESQCSYRYSVQKGVYDFQDFVDTDRMKTVEHMIACSDEFLASFGYERQGVFYKVTKHCEENIAVFCHGGFGCAWLAHLLGMAPGVAFHTLRLGTSSVTTVSFPTSDKGYIRPILRHLGEIHHIRRAGLRINTR